MTDPDVQQREPEWFVRNARDARRLEDDLGAYCRFEDGERFREVGVNLNVLQPVHAVDPVALAHEVGVEEETATTAEAYARFAKPHATPFRDEFLPD